jgi:Lar family restriction alleviation protein
MTPVSARIGEIAELLPCPFCGGEPVKSECRPLDEYSVLCTACGVFMEGDTREQTDAAWNRRPAAILAQTTPQETT